jgi:hypothetical protein
VRKSTLDRLCAKDYNIHIGRNTYSDNFIDNIMNEYWLEEPEYREEQDEPADFSGPNEPNEDR